MNAVRVLIVDDADESRRVLRRALAMDWTIEVIGEAASGREAVSQAAALTPDVILMDVRMPDMDGIEATEDITRRLPGIRVIALTAHEDPDSVRDMLSAGATGYLLKGSSIDDLIAAVHKARGGEGQVDDRVLPTVLEDLRSLLHQERSRRAEAERLARSREEFIQVLSHELRTPLTVIGGALQVLADVDLPPDSTELVTSALRRTADLERVVTGLELVGDPPPTISETAVPSEVLGTALQDLRPDAIDATSGTWRAIRSNHLARAARELVDNAVRHGRRPVEVRAYREGNEGVVRVTDTGDFQPDERLLRPFVQADMSSRRERGGLGLGLFVASRLCEVGGGRLDLRREDDRTVAEARFLLAEE
jgi:DNA-binding NarL/FixJ family response regulator/anti-sigma regulatory factor (Ser/Thr protein kinase)